MKTFVVIAALSTISLATPANLPLIGFANPTIATTFSGIDTGDPTPTAEPSPSPTLDIDNGTPPTLAPGAGRHVYVETSSDSSLVNQWLVVSPNSGNPVTFTTNKALAANWTTTQDSSVKDKENPNGDAMIDTATGFYAYINGTFFPGDTQVHVYDVLFQEKQPGAFSPIIPVVSSITQSVQLAKLTINIFGKIQEERLNVLQTCGGDVGPHLVLSEFFVDGCQNLTLRYAE